MGLKGFTMLELVVVVIIIGVLVAVSLPSMKDPIERSRAKNAEFNLMAIYSAQKRYLLSEKEYYICDTSIPLENRVSGINQNLSIKISDPYFDYNIRASGDGYVASAIRRDGQCRNARMNVTWDNSTIDKQGCAAW